VVGLPLHEIDRQLVAGDDVRNRRREPVGTGADKHIDTPVVTASDIAEVAGTSASAARDRLERLVDAGALARKSAGAGVVYYPNCYDPGEASD